MDVVQLSEFVQLKMNNFDNNIIEIHQIMKNRMIKLRYEDLQYICSQLKNLIEPNISHPSVTNDQFSLQSFIVTVGLATNTFILMNKHDYTRVLLDFHAANMLAYLDIDWLNND